MTRRNGRAASVRILCNETVDRPALALSLSALSGVAAFEWFSPMAMLHREPIYGIGLWLTAALGTFLLDVLALRHGWCGHLCPLGALWSMIGRTRQVRVAFGDASCTRCGDCVKVCPEPRVLQFGDAAASAMIASGECTRCGRCVAIGPESSLNFALRARIRPRAQPAPQAGVKPLVDNVSR